MFLATTLMVLVGLALGLLGSGGSIVTLPVLVYVAHVPGHQAVSMSLVIVGGTSLLGCFLNRQRGALDLRVAFLFAASGIPGAWLGGSVSHLVSARVLLLSFGALLLVAGWRMLSGPAQPSPRCDRLPCLLAGLAVGLLTGFLGVGGGVIILPALVLFAGLEMKTAIGTSLAVIAANCFAALVGQIQYLHFDLPPALGFLAAAAAGMFAGQALVPRVSSTWLRRAFGWAIIGLGALLLLKNAPWNETVGGTTGFEPATSWSQAKFYSFSVARFSTQPGGACPEPARSPPRHRPSPYKPAAETLAGRCGRPSTWPSAPVWTGGRPGFLPLASHARLARTTRCGRIVPDESVKRETSLGRKLYPSRHFTDSSSGASTAGHDGRAVGERAPSLTTKH